MEVGSGVIYTNGRRYFLSLDDKKGITRRGGEFRVVDMPLPLRKSEISIEELANFWDVSIEELDRDVTKKYFSPQAFGIEQTRVTGRNMRQCDIINVFEMIRTHAVRKSS